MESVFTSWSGGKDCSFACYRALEQGMNVRYLANMVSGGGKRSYNHGLSPKILEAQSEAIGIPLIQQQARRNSYEKAFKKMLRSFREEGISGGVFGDIDLDEHRHWIERVCGDVGVIPYLPLWGKRQMEIMEEFIGLGFNAIVVAARAEIFSREWLGHRVDREFIRYVESLSRSREVTPCGEAGEYHTLVVDGPIFKKRLEVIRSRRIQRDGRWFLSILEAVPVEKSG